MGKQKSVKGKSRILEKTIDSLTGRGRASWGIFAFFLIMYFILSIAVRETSGSRGVMMIGGSPVPITVFTGVFSTVSNLCIVLMVIYCGKAGFIASIAVLLIQYPMILEGIFVKKNYTSIPGLFGNLLTLIAVVVIFVNNLKIEEFQVKLREQAVTDLLTGLPNSFASTELIKDLTKRNKPFAAVTIDLDGIKSINNSMGFDMGNKVMIEVASRWKNIANEGLSGTLDFISRISGDEFSLIIRGYASDEEIENTIKQYKDALSRKINIEGYDFSLSAYFGYALFPSDSDDSDSVITYSYTAMREIKRLKNGESILRFSNGLLNARDQLIIENRVRGALENDLIYFNLQPQFDMSHRLRGFEALARMKDVEGNIIRPDEFIPAAERIGLISKVDLAVHKKVSAFFGDLIKRTGTDAILSINVSVKHMMKSDFLSEVRSFLSSSGMPASQLEIEITESVLIESAEKAAHIVTELKEMGIRIAIDDFGTGYSSLSYLNSFPSDVLKIDKIFIDDMNTSSTSQKYVQAIISLAHVMDLEVIAEGVEENEQLETLRNIGCDYIQGYLWGKPMPYEEAEKLLPSTPNNN